MQDDATPENVRRAFKIQALKHHPDKNTSQAEAATQAFQRLVAAYQRLISPTADQSWEDLDLGDVLTGVLIMEVRAWRWTCLHACIMLYIQR